MSRSPHLVYVESCIKLVGDILQPDEHVLRVWQGKTSYGRRTFLYYKVDYGTIGPGDAQPNAQSAVVEIESGQPHGPRFVDDSKWSAIID
jgi:hypothetical protein